MHRALGESYLAILEPRAAEVAQLAARCLSEEQYRQRRGLGSTSAAAEAAAAAPGLAPAAAAAAGLAPAAGAAAAAAAAAGTAAGGEVAGATEAPEAANASAAGTDL
ncbi:hypothetical protein ABPG75_009292 [Micractinium tetrahymenae]